MVLQNCSTPLEIKRQGTYVYGFCPRDAEARNLRCVEEGSKFFQGPMPVRAFMDLSFPDKPLSSLPPMPSATNAFKAVPARVNKESQLYTPFAKCLNAGRCPGFEFEITATRGSGKVKLGDIKPDLCLYSKDVDPTEYTSSDGKPKANMGYAAMFIEAKPPKRLDCFADPEEGEDRSSHQFVLNIANAKKLKNARKDFGQIVSYAVEACARQHLLFYFSISLVGTRARLIRWDRAGAIATESFSIHKNPELLCEFLWRFSHCSDEERGFDVTIAYANKEDEKIFKTVVETHVREQTGLSGEDLKKALEEHYEPKKVAVVHVLEDGSSDRFHQYLVSRPVASPISMACRATRGYWAVCRRTKRIAFLKDTWRYDVKDMDKEGTILQELAKKDVSNIPVVLHHGDVPLRLPVEETGKVAEEHTGKGKAKANPSGKTASAPNGDEKEKLKYQVTRNHEFVNADWVCGTALGKTIVTPHKHYRLVLGTVGYSLDRLEGTNELLHGAFNAYEAMVDALKKAGTIHRDVSVGNILLVKDTTAGNTGPRKGYLIDWELSCRADRKGSTRRRNERTGTWPFMSDRVFSQKTDFVHHIIDDMESMMYVVMYCGLRYLPHSIEGGMFVRLMANFFNAGTIAPDGTIYGSDWKGTNKHDRRHTRLIRFECSAFKAWLDTVMNYNCPSAELSEEERATLLGKWKTPDDLYSYWKDFLSKTKLPTSDRKEHERHPAQPPNNMDLPNTATLVSRSSKPMAMDPRVADWPPAGKTSPTDFAEDDLHTGQSSIPVDSNNGRRMEQNEGTTMPSGSRSTRLGAVQGTAGTTARKGSSSKQAVADSERRSKRKRDTAELEGSTSAQVDEGGGRQVKRRGVAVPAVSESSVVDAAPAVTRRITRSMSGILQASQTRKPSRRRK